MNEKKRIDLSAAFHSALPVFVNMRSSKPVYFTELSEDVPRKFLSIYPTAEQASAAYPADSTVRRIGSLSDFVELLEDAECEWVSFESDDTVERFREKSKVLREICVERGEDPGST